MDFDKLLDELDDGISTDDLVKELTAALNRREAKKKVRNEEEECARFRHEHHVRLASRPITTFSITMDGLVAALLLSTDTTGWSKNQLVSYEAFLRTFVRSKDALFEAYQEAGMEIVDWLKEELSPKKLKDAFDKVLSPDGLKDVLDWLND